MLRLFAIVGFGAVLGLFYSLILWGFARVEQLFDMPKRGRVSPVSYGVFYGFLGVSFYSTFVLGAILYSDYLHPALFGAPTEALTTLEQGLLVLLIFSIGLWMNRHSIARRWRRD